MGPRIFIRGNARRACPLGDVAVASMGPRIFIRGNFRPVGRHQFLKLLQWGRGSSSAETHRARQAVRQDNLLQWGRGSSSAETGFEAMWDDSPIKLQWGRGSSSAETLPAAQSCSRISRFNGAADLHPRKRLPCEWTHRTRTCFNGAADLHPRKRGRPGRRRPRRWGFNGAADLHPRKLVPFYGERVGQGRFNGAADLHPRKRLLFGAITGDSVLLQWGRGSSSAETLRAVPGRGAPGGLQWGRGSSSAETRPSDHTATPVRRFNGAADLHPRKPPPRSPSDPWLKCFNGAADLHPRKRVFRATWARFGRPLQWGRGSSSAETWCACRIPLSCPSLQWGRGSSSAETYGNPATFALGQGFNGAADLHPRKLVRLQVGRIERRSFNGAADLHPRKRRQRGRAGTICRASMGPRIFIRGNERSLVAVSTSVMLQWGRGSSSAETRRYWRRR